MSDTVTNVLPTAPEDQTAFTSMFRQAYEWALGHTEDRVVVERFAARYAKLFFGCTHDERASYEKIFRSITTPADGEFVEGVLAGLETAVREHGGEGRVKSHGLEFLDARECRRMIEGRIRRPDPDAREIGLNDYPKPIGAYVDYLREQEQKTARTLVAELESAGKELSDGKPHKDGLNEERIRALQAKPQLSAIEEMELDDQLVLRCELEAARWETKEGFGREW